MDIFFNFSLYFNVIFIFLKNIFREIPWLKTALIFFKCLNAYLKNTFCILLLLLLLAFIILIQILVY